MEAVQTLKNQEPRQTKITTRLNAQGALLEELRVLVPHIQPATARADLRCAVLEENILRRPSLGSRVYVYGKLSVRYFPVSAPTAISDFIEAVQQESDPSQVALLAPARLRGCGLLLRLCRRVVKHQPS
jgi:hypothetical protein